MEETQVWYLGWEDPPEREMVIHSSILVFKIPWTEESGGLHSIESQRVQHDWVTNTYTNFYTFYYLLNFIIFIFTLQYSIGFGIHQHASTTGVHVFPILNPFPPSSSYHPSGSSQCTSPKLPVSCIEPGLVIHFLYDIIHVSLPFSQIISPCPSPTESKRLFCTSGSLLLSHIQGYHYHLSKFHMYALVYCMGVFLSGLLNSV